MKEYPDALKFVLTHLSNTAPHVVAQVAHGHLQSILEYEDGLPGLMEGIAYLGGVDASHIEENSTPDPAAIRAVEITAASKAALDLHAAFIAALAPADDTPIAEGDGSLPK